MARWEYLTIDLANLPARTDDIDGSTKPATKYGS
jgi:hypothetical protein